MTLEHEDRELIKNRKANNDDYTAEELQWIVRKRNGTPCTSDEVREFIEQDSVQDEIETRRAVIEKNAQYSKQELVNEMLSAKDQINDILTEMREANRTKSTVEAAGELRKTLELLGKTIDAIKDADSAGDQYIRIDQLTVDKLAAIFDSDDIEELADHNGLTVKRKDN